MIMDPDAQTLYRFDVDGALRFLHFSSNGQDALRMMKITRCDADAQQSENHALRRRRPTDDEITLGLVKISSRKTGDFQPNAGCRSTKLGVFRRKLCKAVVKPTDVMAHAPADSLCGVRVPGM